uniref:Glutamate rich 6 n=2 Tax=Meleagris gallopavo TaxID=9103 RepID=A0A803YK40_MELGA
MARQLAFLATEPKTVAECRAQPGTISYLLSQEPPSLTGWTLMPEERAAELEEEPISYSITCCDFTVMGGRVAKNELLEKYYNHGGKFLTMLPDGTAQLFYPSGNLAVIVVREKKRFVCIVQEDKESNTEIRAVFASNGRSTCYHPHGTVWITMNTEGGQCLDRAGNRVRRWMWPSCTASSGPCAPLSPIFLSLNLHVGVRIMGQDKITVSFLAMGQQAKFNVGTKVQGSQAGQLHALPKLNEDELLLLALRVRILRLIDKLRSCLNFPSNEQWDKMKPPVYLVTQTLKILYLCTTSDISEELCSSERFAGQSCSVRHRAHVLETSHRVAGFGSKMLCGDRDALCRYRGPCPSNPQFCFCVQHRHSIVCLAIYILIVFKVNPAFTLRSAAVE